MIGLIALLIRELSAEKPVVDLRALKDRAFSAGVLLISMLGFVLYASLVLLPIYLQTLLGYPAFDAGLALSPRGLGSLCTTPLAGYLTSKTDPRRLVFVGLILGSVTMFSLSGLNLNAGYSDIVWPQIFQGVALSFLFIPLMALSMARIPKEKMGNATSIFNLMRNIGGSFGIATMTTFLTRRTQMHQNRLIERVSPGNLRTIEVLRGLETWFYRRGFDHYTASRKAVGAVYGLVQQHATMLSFVEAFWVMGVIFLLMMPFVFILRDPRIKQMPAPARAETEPYEPAVEQEEGELVAT